MSVSSNEEAEATILNANATKRESEDLTIFGGERCAMYVWVYVFGGKDDWEKVEGFSLYHIRDEAHIFLSVWEDDQAMGQCE